MKIILLTDAETKEQVVVCFGEGGACFATGGSDDQGKYTEIYATGQELLVSVIQTPTEIYSLLRYGAI